MEKRKRERIQERMELLNSADEEEMDNLDKLKSCIFEVNNLLS